MPSITFLTKYQKKKFEERCIEENIHKAYEIKVDYKYKNDNNKIPFIVYLTKEKAKENIRALKNDKKYIIKFTGEHFKKICREALNNNFIFEDVLSKINKNQGEDNPGIYFPPKNKYWTLPSSKDVKLYKKPSTKTISIGFKKRNKKDIINKFNIKNKIQYYYPKLIYISERVLKKYLNHIKKNY